MKNTILISLLFVSTLGLFGNKVMAISTNKHFDAVSIDTAKYAIIKLGEVNLFLFNKSYKPTTLSTKEIKKIEELIKNAVVEYNKGYEEVSQIKDPINYYKQLIAAVNAKGEKEVSIYGYCEKPKFNWRKKIPMMPAGGSCYFQLRINLTKNTFSEISVLGTKQPKILH